MPLEAPQLDTRTFDDLVAEARRRIPRFTPEWTDFNPSDPGMTLVNVFAWLTEQMLFEMNRLPDLNYIKFLKLLDMELRPAQPATAHLTFTATPAAPQAGPVRRGTQVGAQPADGGDLVLFETEDGIGLVRTPLTDVQVYDGADFHVVTDANDTADTPFRPLGWFPQIGGALYLGFDAAAVPPEFKPFPDEISMRVFLTPSAQAGQAQSCAAVHQPPAPPVTLVWEYRREAGDTHWQRLNVFSDGSAAFTREGYIKLQGPAEIAASTIGKVSDARLWLRCRLVKGRYPAGRAPEIDHIIPNTARARSLATVIREVVGTSEGQPEATFTLSRTPVQADSLELTSEVEDGPQERWERRDDLLASSPEDKHFVLNATTGDIRFGDGAQGLIPAAGARIMAESYRYGGGEAANVGPELINALLSAPPGVSEVLNRREAVGGRDEQALEELMRQAPRRLRSMDRAMSADDYAVLAAQAGGVLKASARPLMHPDHPGVEVPGAVTVVIVPDNDDQPPEPSSDLIRSVCGYLESRRLLTTELYVKGPEFIAVKVEARVSARAYASFDAVVRDVRKALNEHLDPRDQDFGADLFPTSLYNVILDVEDVRAVENLSVVVDGRQHDDLTERIVVPGDGLVFSADDHAIVVVPAEDR